MGEYATSAAVNFFLIGEKRQFAFRRMWHVPRIGDQCVFDDVRYRVENIEWCMDEGATEVGIRVNVELRGPRP